MGHRHATVAGQSRWLEENIQSKPTWQHLEILETINYGFYDPKPESSPSRPEKKKGFHQRPNFFL